MAARRRVPSTTKATRPKHGSDATDHARKRARFSAPLIIAVAAVIIRLACFTELTHSPFVDMHQWAQSDMHYFHSWASDIAAGDWLSRSVGVPMHRWHREIAERYLAQHPAERQTLSGSEASPSADPETRLWSRWMETPKFYQDPLYPYLVAATYFLIGSDVRFVFVWQLLAGVLTTLAIWAVTNRYFGALAGASAACLALLSATFPFYEMLLLRDSLVALATIGLVWAIDRAFTRAAVTSFAVVGVALAASLLLKGTFLVTGVAIAAATVWMFRREPKHALGLSCALLAGMLLATLPLIARNLAVNVSAFSTASSGPLTLVASNSGEALPEVGFGISASLATFLGETNRDWSSAVRFLRASHTAGSYAHLLRRKWVTVWHWYDIPNNENIYYMRAQLRTLGWLPVTFWSCTGLALLGMIAALPRRREVWPLYLVFAATLLPLVAFYVLARFRLPLLTVMLPFAGHGLAYLWSSVSAGRVSKAAASIAIVAIVSFWTDGPLQPRQIRIRMADWILPYSSYYQPKIYSALDAHDPATAARLYLEFFRRFEPGRTAVSADRSLALELADMHRECAQILTAARDPQAAREQYAAAEAVERLAGR